MADRYIGPVSAGSGDGTSWANQGTLANLNSFVGAAGPGGKVYIALDQGEYIQTTSVTAIANGGSAGNYVDIVGVDASLTEVDPTAAWITGSRAISPGVFWTSPGTKTPVDVRTWTPGNNLFSITSAAAYLRISNLAIRRVQTPFSMGGSSAHDIIFRDIELFDTRYGIYTDSTSGVYNLQTIRLSALGYSKDIVRMRGTCHHWSHEDPQLDSRWQDCDSFSRAMYIEDDVNDGVNDCHDITITGGVTRKGYFRNSYDSLSASYKNADGISTETFNRNISITGTSADHFEIEGMTDGGVDLKSLNNHLDWVEIIGCKRSFRLWNGRQPETKLTNCFSTNPEAQLSDASVHHIWFYGEQTPGVATSTFTIDDFTGVGGPTGMRAFQSDAQDTIANFSNLDLTLPASGILDNAGGTRVFNYTSDAVAGEVVIQEADDIVSVTGTVYVPTAYPTFVGAGTTYVGLTDAFNVPLPAGLAENDYVLVQVHIRANLQPVLVSAGYTLIQFQTGLSIWGKKLGAGDTGDTVVSFSGAGTDTTIARSFVWRGVDTMTPYESLVTDVNMGGTASRQFPGLNTTGAGRIGILFGGAGNDFPASSFGTSNGWTNMVSFVDVTTTGGDASLWHFQREIPTILTVPGPIVASGAGNMFVSTVGLALIPSDGYDRHGVVVIAENADTVAATGIVPVRAVVTIQEAPDTVSAVVLPGRMGVLNILEADDVVTVSSATVIRGTAIVLEDDDTVSSVLIASVVAILDIFEEDDTVVATLQNTTPLVATFTILEAGDTVSSAIRLYPDWVPINPEHW